MKGGMVRNRAGRYCVAPGEVRVGRLTEPSDSPHLAMPLPRRRHPMSKKRQGYLPSVPRLIVTASSERKVADATPPLANDAFIAGAAIELGHSGGAAMGGPRTLGSPRLSSLSTGATLPPPPPQWNSAPRPHGYVPGSHSVLDRVQGSRCYRGCVLVLDDASKLLVVACVACVA